jgi:hypothetical protein
MTGMSSQNLAMKIVYLPVIEENDEGLQLIRCYVVEFECFGACATGKRRWRVLQRHMLSFIAAAASPKIFESRSHHSH